MLRPQHDLSDLLKASSMARATRYYYLKLLVAPDGNEHIRKQDCAIYHAHEGRYGYLRITLKVRNQSVLANQKKVSRLKHECGLKLLVRIKKYRSYKGAVGRIAPNVLKRNINVSAIKEKWATNVTEFSLLGQKRYLPPIVDLYNGEIVSYTISTNPNLLMVISMQKRH